MKTSLLITLAATIVGMTAAIAYLITIDKDPTVLITSLVIAIPVIGSLFGINKVVNLTNGTLTGLRQQLADKETENAQLRSLLTPTQAAQVPVTKTQIETTPHE